jgi:hypothetical protein
MLPVEHSYIVGNFPEIAPEYTLAILRQLVNVGTPEMAELLKRSASGIVFRAAALL